MSATTLQMPTVAAVIAVYNRPKLVVEALESIAAQTRVPDRLLVVDDGSTDDTAQRVRAWLDHSRLACPQSLDCILHRGLSATRNAAVERVRHYDLVAFLDSDDLWPRDYLARTCRVLGDHPDAVAASTDVLRHDVRTPSRTLLSAARFSGQATRAIFADGCPVPSSTVIRVRDYLRVGGCDETLPRRTDEDLSLRLSLLGPWASVPGDPIVMRFGAHTATGDAPQMTEGQFTPDHAETLAMVRDRFYRCQGGDRVIPRREYRRVVSGMWRTVGKGYAAVGRHGDARRCYRLAMRANPWDLRPMMRLIRASARRIPDGAARSTPDARP